MDTNAIASKLPQVKKWIHQLLAAPENRGRPVADYGFLRLPQFYSDSLLRQVMVIEVDRCPVPPLRQLGLGDLAGTFEDGDYDGITFGNSYFIRRSTVSQESLHFHELVHVLQWNILGWDSFLSLYANGLVAKGYRNSPLEDMAYTLQDHFERQATCFQVEDVVRRQLDTLVKQPFMI